RGARLPGPAAGGMRPPFGTTSYSPGSQCRCDSRACSETAIRWSIRSARNPQTGFPTRIQPRSPDAWKVATIGVRASASTATQIAGVIGSCRWRPSNRSSASAWSSACSTTAPQKDHEYGTTMPTFIADGGYSAEVPHREGRLVVAVDTKRSAGGLRGHRLGQLGPDEVQADPVVGGEPR